MNVKMQLTLFVVIVTFSHLSCEVQWESGPVIVGEIDSLPQQCKENLIKQMQHQCSGNSYQPQLAEVNDCTFTCGDWHDNGLTRAKSRHTINLKDGTPCGYSKMCVGGKCVQTCSRDYVKISG
uniref:Putative tick ixostatin n=2 Tax=Ixodes ricinus TaxID=34613 RepID=V5HA75_IXORI